MDVLQRLQGGRWGPRPGRRVLAARTELRLQGFLSAPGLELGAGRTGARALGTSSRVSGSSRGASPSRGEGATREAPTMHRRAAVATAQARGELAQWELTPSARLLRCASSDGSRTCPSVYSARVFETRFPLPSRAHCCGCNSLLAAQRGEGTAGEGLGPRHAEDGEPPGIVGEVGGQGLGLLRVISQPLDKYIQLRGRAGRAGRGDMGVPSGSQV